MDRSTQVKLWIIFGLFIGLIIGLIVYEVSVYLKAKKQRENFEMIRKFESKQIKRHYEGNDKDSAAAEESAPETSSEE